MSKYLALPLLAAVLLQPVAAAVISPYQGSSCRYEGGVGKDGKPEGKGVWSCRDGRSYTGGFKKGRFDGKGVYTVSAGEEIFLEPFSSGSSKFRDMSLDGTFKDGFAHGKITAVKDGSPLFVMKYDRGNIVEVKLPKKAAKAK